MVIHPCAKFGMQAIMIVILHVLFTSNSPSIKPTGFLSLHFYSIILKLKHIAEFSCVSGSNGNAFQCSFIQGNREKREGYWFLSLSVDFICCRFWQKTLWLWLLMRWCTTASKMPPCPLQTWRMPTAPLVCWQPLHSEMFLGPKTSARSCQRGRRLVITCRYMSYITFLPNSNNPQTVKIMVGC